MSVVVNRSQTIPCVMRKTFTTYLDMQKEVQIKVYEGQRSLTKDCYLLGSFELSGINPAPRGVAQIEIKIDIDANGIIRVSAQTIAQGAEAQAA